MNAIPAAPAQTGASPLARDVLKRRTSPSFRTPDAGKTTLTEKLLLFGGAIQMAGTVKARKSGKYATSDWMEVERERGISVASSVMQFTHGDCVFNLLDTPGHKDFSEDTYRVLTAVDAAIMVVDAAKGVEEQTIKLLEVCRLRDTPIITFINKMDREVREPLELLDEIESILKIHCAPVTWPIGMGKRFQGVYHLINDEILRFKAGEENADQSFESLQGLGEAHCASAFRSKPTPCCRKSSWCAAPVRPSISTTSSKASRRRCFSVPGSTTSACAKCCAPWPTGHRHRSRARRSSACRPHRTKFTGFVFKIQANMDPQHRTASPSSVSAPAATVPT